ncbi:winged helix-turn-helix domain-containing protein [Burkholderia sp. Ax-1724]|nr:winged helix-turn-helix domain-containing protein [Burkholderia sp. Ax-1724]NIF78224.1 winged helix-turn-helix domain-containing protein [Paraburkholderia sp. Cy-641]
MYLRFLQLTEAQRGLPTLPALDPLEEKILEFVVRATQNKERLPMKDMMGHSELSSPATLHGRISSMCEKGWIVLNDTEDARRKQIELTPASLRHFDKLAEAFAKAAKGAWPYPQLSAGRRPAGYGCAA